MRTQRKRLSESAKQLKSVRRSFRVRAAFAQPDTSNDPPFEKICVEKCLEKKKEMERNKGYEGNDGSTG